MAGLAGHRFRRIGGAAGFGRIAWIGGLKPVSTARLYSPSLQPALPPASLTTPRGSRGLGGGGGFGVRLMIFHSLFAVLHRFQVFRGLSGWGWRRFPRRICRWPSSRNCFRTSW
ncbi:hypothetical protein BWP02_04810 [Neisseria gonorrhoeae]|nr:hypothetical protein BWP02_04810 [Neisseria gonorrhoeae]